MIKQKAVQFTHSNNKKKEKEDMEKSQVERKLLFQHFLVSQLKSTEEREPLLPPKEYDSYLHLLQRSQKGLYEGLVST